MRKLASLVLLSTLFFTSPRIEAQNHFELNKKSSYKIPYLFEHQRKHDFTFLPWNLDNLDNTSLVHYAGSCTLFLGVNYWLDSEHIKDGELKAGGIVLGLGLLKELEDGFREGFGRKDFVCDFAGVFTGYLINRAFRALF